ncbi:MAG: hypothetical protein ABIH23_08980 [bacterium]
MGEQSYSVVWPLGRKIQKTFHPVPRLDTLEGKTIGELWNYAYAANIMFPIIEEMLTERYPDITFVNYAEFGNTHGPKEREVIEALPDKLAGYGCDAVISGVGG